MVSSIHFNLDKSKILSSCNGLNRFQYHFSYTTGPSALIHAFLGIFHNNIPHIILTQPMTLYQRNHCESNGQKWERNKSFCNDYHQFLDRNGSHWKSNQRPSSNCYHQLNNLSFLCPMIW